MEVTTTGAGNRITVIAVRGEIDVQTAGQLLDAVHAALDVPVPRIVLNLADVRFCDSTGLSVFGYGHRHSTNRGGFLRLAAPTTFLTRVLTVVGIAQQIPVFDTVAAAVDAKD
jgi:anti-sigma B factor antagonist